jgi:alanine racemase
MPRPTQAYIDLSALTHNLNVTRQYAPHARLTAIIKADAYGHGLLHTAHALKETDGFALLELDAAIELREAGYHHPILLLEGFFSTEELALFEQYQLSAVIHHSEQVAMLSTCKQRGLDIFLKINTGMNRLGFSPEQFPSALEKLATNQSINHITLMTHFANADDVIGNKSFTQQLQCFNRITAQCKQPTSLANSAAIIRYPETHADWVRPGIMLYGASPFADKTAAELNLKPVMTLASHIIAIHDLESGDSTGYGSLFQADQAMKIGIVACGYADGYPRHALTNTPVLVNNQRSRTLGRVSMDMLAIDLTGIENAQLNSPVVLWGKGMPVEEIAQAADTISYELLCALSPRVEKIVTNSVSI